MPASLRVPHPSACIRNTRRYYLGGSWVLVWWTGTKRDLLSGDPRPRREEETQTRGQAAAWREHGRCSTDLSRPSGPSLPFSEQNHPPKPSRAGGKAGRRLQSSVRGQHLCKALSPPQAERDILTAPGHFSALTCGSRRHRHLAGCQRQHGHMGQPTCGSWPLLRANAHH